MRRRGRHEADGATQAAPASVKERSPSPTRIAKDAAPLRTRKRTVGIYEVEESIPTLSNLLPGVSAWKWLDGFRASLPFLWALFAELAQGASSPLGARAGLQAASELTRRPQVGAGPRSPSGPRRRSSSRSSPPSSSGSLPSSSSSSRKRSTLATSRTSASSSSSLPCE